MKHLLVIILIAALSYISGLIFPWWTIAVVAFFVAYLLNLRPLPAFFSGFTAIFMLWFVLAFYLSYSNHHILATKMAGVIFKSDSPFLLIIVSAFTGGVVAGLAALTAAYLRPGKTNQPLAVDTTI